MSDYDFIKEFNQIKIGKFCKENNINTSNILGGTSSKENYRILKEYIIDSLMNLLIKDKKENVVCFYLYDDIVTKLKEENKILKEML